MGTSFGGYLAPRAATGDFTPAALIADPGQMELTRGDPTRLPGFLARELRDARRFMLDLIDRVWRARLRSDQGVGHSSRPLGAWGQSPHRYLRLTTRYSLAGRSTESDVPR